MVYYLCNTIFEYPFDIPRVSDAAPAKKFSYVNKKKDAVKKDKPAVCVLSIIWLVDTRFGDVETLSELIEISDVNDGF